MRARHRKFRLTKSPLTVAMMASLVTMAPLSGASAENLSASTIGGQESLCGESVRRQESLCRESLCG
jgi:hypothetical protein